MERPLARVSPLGCAFVPAAALGVVLLAIALGCDASGPVGRVEECPDELQAGLRAATSCAATLGAVEGRVVDADEGTPIVGAIVATSPATRTTLTDADGRFEIDRIDLTGGDVALAVTAARSGYLSDSKSVTLRPEDGRATVGLRLRSPEGPVLVGGLTLSVLVRHAGVPYAGGSVEVLDVSGAVVSTATTDANGFAFFTLSEAGAYTVRATATIAGRPFRAVGGTSVNAGSVAYVELDLRQAF